jgi:hypothetical protein
MSGQINWMRAESGVAIHAALRASLLTEILFGPHVDLPCPPTQTANPAMERLCAKSRRQRTVKVPGAARPQNFLFSVFYLLNAARIETASHEIQAAGKGVATGPGEWNPGDFGHDPGDVG